MRNGLRVVISGGAGFLGSHLATRLLDDGHDVVCLDNFSTGRPENVAHLMGRTGFRLVDVDVTNAWRVDGAVDAVLHFASPASPPDYLSRPIETLLVSSVGTMHMLDLARAKDARMMLASTSEVYGDPEVHPQPEQYWGNVNPIGPRSVYDEGKRFGEAVTTAYRVTHDLNTTIVRLFNSYGPRMRVDDGRMVPTFIKQALLRQPLTVAGGGTQTRSLCYVEDTVEGIVRLLHSGHSGPVNIGSEYELSVLEIAYRICRLAGSDSPVRHVPLPQNDPRLRRPDITLAKNLLDWQPEISIQEGLRRTIAWFRNRLKQTG
ncbi:UDP-glucuronic acid decarboxylase family protein [Actinokineospora diospyrosa]|uniref:dTDP-glucose 4,6-dehydratase n=1 Tax=Actinokineospora diospyrosa TaxID=103728 RepID=A0ABT1I5P7_9PSEU|nr:UDP-glucuronic acid decarboxylase family protein [Actinokineospora diospyrosa]MCP2267906.1 dTDP-glucose 4,6-dehydratase [Actinokineospora diospyrosa]